MSRNVDSRHRELASNLPLDYTDIRDGLRVHVAPHSDVPRRELPVPFLPIEPYCQPDDLFDGSFSIDSGRWWAIYTKPRAEKSLARKIYSQGVSFFLPLYKRQYRSNRRTFRGFLPLFTGYIFVFGDTEARLKTLKTNLVSRVIEVSDQEGLHHDLMQVYRLMQSGFAIAPENRLAPGTPVRVLSGPLAGVEGKVLSNGNRNKIVVEVRLLQAAVSAELETWMLQPVTV